MMLNLYTVRDKTAEQCGPVFQAINDGVASRNVIHMLEKVPAYDRDSFELWKIGEFNDDTGYVDSVGIEVVSITIPRFDDVKQREFGFEKE